VRRNLKGCLKGKTSGLKKHELHIRLYNLDEFATQNEIQYYQKIV
jgi:hypothetical protein